MNITNLCYADGDGATIDMDVTLGDGTTIPFTYHPDDPAPVSCAVRELLAAGGHAIGAYVPPPSPPAPPITVAASSAKLVLDEDGLYDQVETMCLAHPVKAVRIFWDSANTWVEDNVYVVAIGTELDLTTEQMHDKFVRARDQY